MGFTASFSSGPQLYESWREFPIDLLYKDVSSLDTKWRQGQKFEDPPCPNSQYIGTLWTPEVTSSPLTIYPGAAPEQNQDLAFKFLWQSEGKLITIKKSSGANIISSH